MNRTSIEWTDFSWNPVTGCHKVSAGCKNCYAETLTNRFGKVWGQENFRAVTMHHDRLNEPVVAKSRLVGKRVFVCDMSDLFHEDVTFEFIEQVFAIMASLPATTFQVLTKRPKRMAEYTRGRLLRDLPILTNVWCGTSVENQLEAQARISDLSRVHAWVRFVSAEPLIDPIDLSTVEHYSIDWLIVGGESGRRARPMHPDWARSLRDQCTQFSIPYFFKQWGEWFPQGQTGHTKLFADTGQVTDFNLRHYQMPMGRAIHRFKRLGKTAQRQFGKMLDGVVHQTIPRSAPNNSNLMKESEIINILNEILIRQGFDNVKPFEHESNLKDLLKMDSLDRVEYVMEVEKVFNITITDEQTEDTQTFGQFVQLILDKKSIRVFGDAPKSSLKA